MEKEHGEIFRLLAVPEVCCVVLDKIVECYRCALTEAVSDALSQSLLAQRLVVSVANHPASGAEQGHGLAFRQAVGTRAV